MKAEYQGPHQVQRTVAVDVKGALLHARRKISFFLESCLNKTSKKKKRRPKKQQEAQFAYEKIRKER